MARKLREVIRPGDIWICYPLSSCSQELGVLYLVLNSTPTYRFRCWVFDYGVPDYGWTIEHIDPNRFERSYHLALCGEKGMERIVTCH